jgi:hypothetical protein
MNIIETTAPITIENLKLFFENKETKYLIDYEKSILKEEKLLVYLSNLEIPCDIKFSNVESFDELLKIYLKSSVIVKIPSLEFGLIDLLLQYNEINTMVDGEFIKEIEEDLAIWSNKLKSLSLYNVYTINDESMQNWVKQFPEDDTTETKGINFVSLLSNSELYRIFEKVNQSELKYYSSYFEKYMFKGQNLFSFWANENNPMFIINNGIASGSLDNTEYFNAQNKTIQELIDVSSSK